MAQHFGGLIGMTSVNAIIPELKLGVAIYTNQQGGGDKAAILYSILEAYLIDRKTDWPEKLHALQQKKKAEAAAIVGTVDNPVYKPTGPIAHYMGTYQDPWFGNVVISKVKNKLYFKSARSVIWRGSMVPVASGLFIVRWDDRSWDADAYVNFSTDFTGKPQGFTMKAVSPLTDFSFDFHDLNFTRFKSN